MPDFHSEKLYRSITRFGVASLVLNGLIGAGIFKLPSAVAGYVGAFGSISFLICGLMMFSIIEPFGKAASYFKGTGGPVLYAQTAFGSHIGFQTGWLLYLGRVTAFSANCNALVDYLAGMWQTLNSEPGRIAAILIICIFFTFINYAGVKRGMFATNALTFLKMIPIFIFLAIGISYVKPAHFVAGPEGSAGEVSAAILVMVYAFVGFEGALVPAGESRNPKKDIPNALRVTVFMTMVIYFLIQTVCFALLPNLPDSITPLADAGAVLFGEIGLTIMTLAAFFSIAGNLSSIFVAAPRMTYALALDKSLPDWFGKVDDKYKTPGNSILFLGVITFILASTGSFIWLAIMSSLARIIGYGICIAGLPKIKRHFMGNVRLHLVGEILIPVLALLLCFWLATQAPLRTWLLTIGFIVFGFLLYWLAGKLKKEDD